MAVRQPISKNLELIRKLFFANTTYNKYGLYHDDVLEEYPHIKEALRRLPSEEKEQRDWRIYRALHFSMKKIYLPKEEWTSFEENEEKGRYLQPYIQEVLEEINEQKAWLKQ